MSAESDDGHAFAAEFQFRARRSTIIPREQHGKSRGVRGRRRNLAPQPIQHPLSPPLLPAATTESINFIFALARDDCRPSEAREHRRRLAGEFSSRRAFVPAPPRE